MHCPENIDGNCYVEMVAAVSILLAKDLSSAQTFILAEFMQAVSYQLGFLAAFKDTEEHRHH